MAGIKNNVLVGKNADFSQVDAPNPNSSESNGLFTNGQLWIGTTAVNAGGTHINVGTITSPLGTLSIGYSSPNITMDLVGGSTGVDSFGMQSGTSPVVPNAAGLVTFNGSTTGAGTNPVITVGGLNTMSLTVQRSQAIAVSNANNVGLAAFDSARFTVDANGFVSANGSGIGETITGDDTTALSPSSGNWNIFGRAGSKTNGSGSTLTVKSPPFSQVGSTSTSVLNSGEFVTATVTRTLPATAGLLDGDLVIYCCTTANALTITANTGQTIRVGTLISSSGGTCTSTAIGDSISLRFDATAIVWRAVSVIGTWLIA